MRPVQAVTRAPPTPAQPIRNLSGKGATGISCGCSHCKVRDIARQKRRAENRMGEAGLGDGEQSIRTKSLGQRQLDVWRGGKKVSSGECGKALGVKGGGQKVAKARSILGVDCQFAR